MQVVLVTCLVSTSLGAPQLFPFSNLRSYFEHQSRNGPGNDKSASTPELTTIVDAPLFQKPAKAEEFSSKVSKYPKNHLPPNHKLEASPSLEPPSAGAAASPIVRYHPPIPEQVLKAPAATPPIIYRQESTQDKTNNERLQLQISPYVSQIPLTVVGEKYVPYPGLLPSTQPQLIPGLAPAPIQNPPVILLPTAPGQIFQSPVPTSEYIEEFVQIPKDTTKTNKSPSNSYPKKWVPEKQKEASKIKYPKEEEKKSEVLKNERKQTKDYLQSIGASSSYPKTLVPVFPKVSGHGEQVQEIIKILHARMHCRK